MPQTFIDSIILGACYTTVWLLGVIGIGVATYTMLMICIGLDSSDDEKKDE